MTILTLPSLKISSSMFGLDSHTALTESIFTRASQTIEWPGARWRARLTLPPMPRQVATPWMVLLAKLRGQAGRVYVGDPDYAVSGPRGTALGSGLVKGPDQTGTTLLTDGWTPNQAHLFYAGDYIAFDTFTGRELKILTQDVASDSSGNATLVFEPPIRLSPNDNQAIITAAPTCVMMLTDPVSQWESNNLKYSNITLDLVEAL